MSESSTPERELGKVYRYLEGKKDGEPLGELPEEDLTRDVFLEKWGAGCYVVEFAGNTLGPIDVKHVLPAAAAPAEQPMTPATAAGEEPGIWVHSCEPKGKVVRVPVGETCPHCAMDQDARQPAAEGPMTGLWGHSCPEGDSAVVARVPKGESCPGCGMDEEGHRPEAPVTEKTPPLVGVGPDKWAHTCMGQVRSIPWGAVCETCGRQAPEKPAPVIPTEEDVTEALDQAVDDGLLTKKVDEAGETVYIETAEQIEARHQELLELHRSSVLPVDYDDGGKLVVASLSKFPTGDYFPVALTLKATTPKGAEFTQAYQSTSALEEALQDLEDGAHLDINTAVAVAKALLSIAARVPEDFDPTGGAVLFSLDAEEIVPILELKEQLKVEEWLEKNDPPTEGGEAAEGGEAESAPADAGDPPAGSSPASD